MAADMMPGLEEDFWTSGPLVSQLEQARDKRLCGRVPREWRNQLWAVAEEAAELAPTRAPARLLVAGRGDDPRGLPSRGCLG